MTEIDPQAEERLDVEVEEALLDIADEFVDTATRFSCELAQHRNSDVVEAKDLQLHLGRSQNDSQKCPCFYSCAQNHIEFTISGIYNES